MQIAITGATGLIGSALRQALTRDGHQVLAISRSGGAGGIRWDPARRQLDTARLAGVEAVVHLAGENIAGGRWTPARKELLRGSRIPTTRWLSELLGRLEPRPRIMISASAMGVYGSRADELLNEASTPGTDFLARLATDWEDAADPARQAGIRVVHPRFGIVLSTAGGALPKLILPFRLGLGGPVGDGTQWMSWIAIDDVTVAMGHILAREAVTGPVNFTSPAPVRNQEFARALGRAMHRPAWVPAPAFALRLVLGEMADATLLASQRVEPARLIESGFKFRYQDIGGALEALLGRSRPGG